MTQFGPTTKTNALPTSPAPWKPRKEQLKAVKHVLSNAEAGIFGEPGVGKTSIFLAAIKVLLQNKLCRRALIIAPLRVCYQVWPDEIRGWKDFQDINFHILHNKGKQDFFLNKEASIFLINPEGLPWLMEGRRFEQLGAEVLLIDESSKFKAWNTQRLKLLKKKLPAFQRRWIATGSPAPNSYLDLFSQQYILDLGKTFGPYITHFRMRYFYNPDRMGWTWVLQKGAQEQIQNALKPYILRMENKELPEVVENVIRVELPPEARKVYDELEEQFITQLKNGEIVTAMSAGTASVKLCQIANGSLYYDNELERRSTTLHEAKIEALKELIDELQGQPLLVGYEFQHDLQHITKALFSKKDAPYIGGGVSTRRAEELVTQWNNGELPVLLGHPASMGHGLNLQKGGCRHVAWFGINWDWELVDQMIRRIRRPGNKHESVFVHYIVASHTVDEAKIKALHAKQRNQNTLLAALKEYAVTR